MARRTYTNEEINDLAKEKAAAVFARAASSMECLRGTKAALALDPSDKDFWEGKVAFWENAIRRDIAAELRPLLEELNNAGGLQ